VSCEPGTEEASKQRKKPRRKTKKVSKDRSKPDFFLGGRRELPLLSKQVEVERFWVKGRGGRRKEGGFPRGFCSNGSFVGETEEAN